MDPGWKQDPKHHHPHPAHVVALLITPLDGATPLLAPTSSPPRSQVEEVNRLVAELVINALPGNTATRSAASAGGHSLRMKSATSSPVTSKGESSPVWLKVATSSSWTCARGEHACLRHHNIHNAIDNFTHACIHRFISPARWLTGVSMAMVRLVSVASRLCERSTPAGHTWVSEQDACME